MMRLFSKKKQGVQPPHVLLSQQAAHTHFAESYRTLRANIHLAGLELNVRSLLITSAGPGEGKTSVSANLGWTTARQGKSVVLVDCDLRRPCLSTTVDSSGSIGVTGLTSDILGSDINDSGRDKQCGLPDLLTLIELQRRTGKLLVRDHSESVELYFLHGKAVDLAWPTSPPHLSLAALLNKEQIGGVINAVAWTDDTKLKAALNVHVAEALQRLNAMSAPAFLFTELSATQVGAGDGVELAALPQQIVRTVFRKNELPYLDRCIRQAAVQADEYLYVLPSGAIPPNPSELSGSARLHFLLSRLKHLYDLVIVDTPPVLPVSDALLLSSHVDGVIVTVKTGFMNRMMIGKAIDQLRDAKANLLGVVLNQVDTKREGYYHYYHKYSSDYYGERSK
jgi:Mrp family chromosome partitioning ATPase